MLREESTVDDLGERLGAELVGRFRVREVVQGDVEVPARRTIPQVSLGPRLLEGTLDGRIHRRGRSSQGVNQAGTLLARGIQRTRGLFRIGEGTGGSHDEILDDVHLLARAHGRKQGVRLDALEDDCADTRHLWGRHGRAGEVVVVASGNGGEDVTTGCRDLGLEA